MSDESLTMALWRAGYLHCSTYRGRNTGKHEIVRRGTHETIGHMDVVEGWEFLATGKIPSEAQS